MKKEQRIRFLGVHIFRGKISLNKARQWRLRHFLKKSAHAYCGRPYFKFLAGKLKMLTRVTPTVNLASQDNCCKTFNKKEKLILYKTSLRANYFLQIVVSNFKFAFGWDFWQTVQFILILVREKKILAKRCDS